MKPINAEEIVRVFNGWLEEADSLAEREAIECCIDHIRDAPAVSQQELRSYMLPWFSPFAAPWCGKIQRAFPKAYVTMNFELILVPRTNIYINLNHCSTPDEFKAEVIEGVSRFAFKAFTKPLRKEHLDGINKLLDTKFTPEDMEYIYTNLGTYGKDAQLTKAVEEMSELTKALCKLKECKRKYDTPFNRETQEVHSNIEEEIADVFIMLVQLFAIFNPHELVNITKVVWDKLDRLKDNLDKEAAKQEASDAGKE